MKLIILVISLTLPSISYGQSQDSLVLVKRSRIEYLLSTRKQNLLMREILGVKDNLISNFKARLASKDTTIEAQAKIITASNQVNTTLSGEKEQYKLSYEAVNKENKHLRRKLKLTKIAIIAGVILGFLVGHH